MKQIDLETLKEIIDFLSDDVVIYLAKKNDSIEVKSNKLDENTVYLDNKNTFNPKEEFEFKPCNDKGEPLVLDSIKQSGWCPSYYFLKPYSGILSKSPNFIDFYSQGINTDGELNYKKTAQFKIAGIDDLDNKPIVDQISDLLSKPSGLVTDLRDK